MRGQEWETRGDEKIFCYVKKEMNLNNYPHEKEG